MNAVRNSGKRLPTRLINAWVTPKDKANNAVKGGLTFCPLTSEESLGVPQKTYSSYSVKN
jgi:hypothetical protein